MTTEILPLQLLPAESSILLRWGARLLLLHLLTHITLLLLYFNAFLIPIHSKTLYLSWLTDSSCTNASLRPGEGLKEVHYEVWCWYKSDRSQNGWSSTLCSLYYFASWDNSSYTTSYTWSYDVFSFPKIIIIKRLLNIVLLHLLLFLKNSFYLKSNKYIKTYYFTFQTLSFLFPLPLLCIFTRDRFFS